MPVNDFVQLVQLNPKLVQLYISLPMGTMSYRCLSEDGSTAILVAAQDSHCEIVRILLDAKLAACN